MWAIDEVKMTAHLSFYVVSFDSRPLSARSTHLHLMKSLKYTCSRTDEPQFVSTQAEGNAQEGAVQALLLHQALASAHPRQRVR